MHIINTAFSADDRVLIKVLRQEKGYGVKVKVKCAILLLEFRRGAHIPS